MHKKVLITGASGLIGTRLTEMLLERGYHVAHLSRSSKRTSVPVFQWDVKEMKMDEQALQDVGCIIHLAGAGIADKPWTDRRKKEIVESRTKSTQLLLQTLRDHQHQVKTLISASAIGYYGNGDADKVFEEKDKPADDFLGNVVKQWEAAVEKISSLGLRVIRLRIGILLSENGGALVEIVKPIRWGLGSPLGSGKQIISWVHIDDVCNMFIKGMEDLSMHGAYNAVSPHPTTNEELTKQIAKVMRKPLWLPRVPEFALKLILGEMATLILGGSNVSSGKIQNTGFEFLYTDLNMALRNLLLK